MDPAQLSSRDVATRACMLERLGARRMPSAQVSDPFVAAVLATYQQYWLRALLSRHAADRGEGWLLAALRRELPPGAAAQAATMDELETLLEPALLEHGYHALLGTTQPLRELMLWKAETQADYQVTLPEGEQRVTVVFLDEFASLGWAGFATCDRHHSGGWTGTDRLYAVRSAYDLGSEEFRVSYLAHEAQHFADGARFPDLHDQAQLEYRAKLVELATARATAYELVEAFAGNTSDDAAVPHSFANARLVRDMSQRLSVPGETPLAWQSIDVARINAAAAALLREDSARLLRGGGA